MVGEARRRAAARPVVEMASAEQLAAAQTFLQEAVAKGSAEELEQQLLFHSRRARVLAGEVAKANILLAGKDARIAELEKLLKK